MQFKRLTQSSLFFFSLTAHVVCASPLAARSTPPVNTCADFVQCDFALTNRFALPWGFGLQLYGTGIPEYDCQYAAILHDHLDAPFLGFVRGYHERSYFNVTEENELWTLGYIVGLDANYPNEEYFYPSLVMQYPWSQQDSFFTPKCSIDKSTNALLCSTPENARPGQPLRDTFDVNFHFDYVRLSLHPPGTEGLVQGYLSVNCGVQGDPQPITTIDSSGAVGLTWSGPPARQ